MAPKSVLSVFYALFFKEICSTQEKYEVMFFGPISKTIDQIKKTYRDDSNWFELDLVIRPFLKKMYIFQHF